MMVLLFLGTGDAFGSGGRLPTASVVTTSTRRVLVDCGAATLAALRREGIEPGTIDAVCLTHLHGDHFAGVPLLLMDAHYASGRTRPLLIAGPAGTRQRVETLLDLYFPGTRSLPYRFSVDWFEWDAGVTVVWPGLTVTPVAVSHSEATPCFGLRLEADGRVLAFSGDTEWTEALIGLTAGSDLFVCECFGYDQAPARHLDYQTLMGHRAELGCRRLMLTHMSPSMLARIRSLGVPTASDGLLVVV